MEFYTSNDKMTDITNYNNEDVKKIIVDKTGTGFVSAYVREDYGVAFVCVNEDEEDSFEDEWKILFFKEEMDTSTSITIDNIDDLDNNSAKYKIYKELEGNYEEVIKISCDLIAKHKDKVESAW